MLIDDIKTVLQISSSNNSRNAEIEDLISAAQADLALSGVATDKTIDVSDPLIRRAITTYCKANFGYENADYERLQASYDSQKARLSMAGDYLDG